MTLNRASTFNCLFNGYTLAAIVDKVKGEQVFKLHLSHEEG